MFENFASVLLSIGLLLLVAAAGWLLSWRTSRYRIKNNTARTLASLVMLSAAIEEVIFRSPLLMFFNGLSGAAWIGILISSVAFGGLHIAYFYLGWKHSSLKRAVANSLFAMPFGIAFGWLCVQNQSLLVPFVAHASWNLAALIIGLTAKSIKRRRRAISAAAQPP